LKLVVDHGAPALAGVLHSLVARYGLCGIEYLPAHIEWLMGVAGCVIAGIMVLAIAIRTIRQRSFPAMSDSAEDVSVLGSLCTIWRSILRFANASRASSRLVRHSIVAFLKNSVLRMQ
jgi:hypothetical protein